MKGLILAGGLGTRLRPLSHTGAKQLVPIANKPVLHYVIEDLKNAGITDIGIIVGYTEERINSIKDSLGDGLKWGVRIIYIEQDAPRGLAHAVAISEGFMAGDDFVVYLGDNILNKGITQFVNDFKKSNYDASLLLTPVDNPQIYGTAVVDANGNVAYVEEKSERPRSNLAIVGVYLFRNAAFNEIKSVQPGKNGELQLTDAIKMLVNDKNKIVNAHIVEGWWDDTGTAEAVLRANYLMLMDLKHGIDGNVHSKAKMMGNVSVGKGTVIDEGCVIKGPVIIGKNTTIEKNTYIGPYTSIGDNVVISGCEIESSIVMDYTKIKFKGKIVDSIIGKDCQIQDMNEPPKGYRFILGEHSEVKV